MRESIHVMPDGTVISGAVAGAWQQETGVGLPGQQGPPEAERLDDFPAEGAMPANTDAAAKARAAQAFRRVATRASFDQQERPPD